SAEAWCRCCIGAAVAGGRVLELHFYAARWRGSRRAMSAVRAVRASRWHMLLELARADFLERGRRYSFLITLLFAMYFGYLAATGKIMLRVGNLRGVYNSAWI